MEFKKRQSGAKFSSRDSVNLTQRTSNADNWLFEDEDWFNLKKEIAKDKERKHYFKRILKRSRNLITEPKFKIKKLVKKFSKKQKVIFTCFLVVVLGFGGLVFFRQNEPSFVAGANDTKKFDPSQPLPREKPEFPILYPGGKDESSVGEIVKNSPPDKPASYVYLDNLGGVDIKVSQQSLPDPFKVNQDSELQKLAEGFQASEVIQVDSIKAFHGSSESGVQSLIFIKGNLLVLIASKQKITDDTWAAYISALHN